MKTAEVNETGTYTVYSEEGKPEQGIRGVKVFRLSLDGPLEIGHSRLGSVPLSDISSHYFWEKQ